MIGRAILLSSCGVKTYNLRMLVTPNIRWVSTVKTVKELKEHLGPCLLFIVQHFNFNSRYNQCVNFSFRKR